MPEHRRSSRNDPWLLIVTAGFALVAVFSVLGVLSLRRVIPIPVVKAARQPYPCLVVANTVHKLCGGAESVETGEGSP